MGYNPRASINLIVVNVSGPNMKVHVYYPHTAQLDGLYNPRISNNLIVVNESGRNMEVLRSWMSYNPRASINLIVVNKSGPNMEVHVYYPHTAQLDGL